MLVSGERRAIKLRHRLRKTNLLYMPILRPNVTAIAGNGVGHVAILHLIGDSDGLGSVAVIDAAGLDLRRAYRRNSVFYAVLIKKVAQLIGAGRETK